MKIKSGTTSISNPPVNPSNPFSSDDIDQFIDSLLNAPVQDTLLYPVPPHNPAPENPQFQDRTPLNASLACVADTSGIFPGYSVATSSKHPIVQSRLELNEGEPLFTADYASPAVDDRAAAGDDFSQRMAPVYPMVPPRAEFFNPVIGRNNPLYTAISTDYAPATVLSQVPNDYRASAARGFALMLSSLYPIEPPRPKFINPTILKSGHPSPAFADYAPPSTRVSPAKEPRSMTLNEDSIEDPKPLVSSRSPLSEFSIYHSKEVKNKKRTMDESTDTAEIEAGKRLRHRNYMRNLRRCEREQAESLEHYVTGLEQKYEELRTELCSARQELAELNAHFKRRSSF